jgi:hypothetical protein
MEGRQYRFMERKDKRVFQEMLPTKTRFCKRSEKTFSNKYLGNLKIILLLLFLKYKIEINPQKIDPFKNI